MAVFVLDKQKRPLMPCTPKRARELLASGRARVHLLFPFCIRLVDRTAAQSTLQPLTLKIDPGSVASGIAVCRIEDVVEIVGVVEPVMHIQFLLELVHRGKAIQATLHARASMRRRRRSKKKGPGLPGEAGVESEGPETAEAEEPLAEVYADDGGPSPEASRELIANWDVPSWTDIVAGLHRPNGR